MEPAERTPQSRSSAPPPLRVLPATIADQAVIAQILQDVQTWLRAAGIAQWQHPFPAEWIADRVAAGEFWIAWTDTCPVAVLRVLDTDAAFWGPGDQGDALYLHTLAVARTWAGRGIGRWLLQWATTQARAQGRRRLRLDCAADNDRLIAYYRVCGFTVVGTAGSGPTRVRLCERAVAGS